MASSKRVKLAIDEVIDRYVDVWQAIFKMLAVKARIRLEMTNKRLRMLMFEYWKRVTSFDAECLTKLHYKPSASWAAALVALCVNRIGDGLRSLTIRGIFFDSTTWSDLLGSIAKGCPNIETMHVVFGAAYRTLEISFESFSRLKTLTFLSADVDSAAASASIFLSIPSSIEVIRGLTGREDEPFENTAQIEAFFADRPSLREIYLYNFYTRDKSKADVFRFIAERCPYLKSIKLPANYENHIDFSGVVALESMKELRICDDYLDEMQIVTICERSPLVETLELKLSFSSNRDLQSAALNALGALKKLGELRLDIYSTDLVAPSLVTEFVGELSRNSRASLRQLYLPEEMPLSTAAIEALANGRAKLRDVTFHVRVGEATPASIRLLIDCIVADPSWIRQTGERKLLIGVNVVHANFTDRISFRALALPAANLPAGVVLNIADDYSDSDYCYDPTDPNLSDYYDSDQGS